MRGLLATGLSLLVVACGGDGGRDGGPARDGDLFPTPSCGYGAGFRGEPTEGGLLVGEREGNTFVPYVADHQAFYEWGFQGGTMILPVVGVPLEVAGDERCFAVTLRHLPDPEAPEAFGGVGRFESWTFELEATVDGDVVWTEPMQDQIGDAALDGTRLLLEVTVRGSHFARTQTVAIEVVPGGEEACRALVLEGGGGGTCPYRRVPGKGVVLSIETHEPAPGEAACPEPREVLVRFEPDDADTAICYEGLVDDPTTHVLVGDYRLHPPASCLTDVTVGSRLPMTLRAIAGGTCAPILYDFDLPDCAAACADP